MPSQSPDEDSLSSDFYNWSTGIMKHERCWSQSPDEDSLSSDPVSRGGDLSDATVPSQSPDEDSLSSDAHIVGLQPY